MAMRADSDLTLGKIVALALVALGYLMAMYGGLLIIIGFFAGCFGHFLDRRAKLSMSRIDVATILLAILFPLYLDLLFWVMKK